MALSVRRGLFAGAWGERPLLCLVITWMPWCAEHSRLDCSLCEARSLLPLGGSTAGPHPHSCGDSPSGSPWTSRGSTEAPAAARLLRGPEHPRGRVTASVLDEVFPCYLMA